MSFADDLRKIKPISQEEVWRNFCKSAGESLASQVPNSCKVAALNGKKTAYIYKEYFTHMYTDIPFPYQTTTLFGFVDSPYIRIMKSEISPIVEKKCNELGLRLIRVDGTYNRNGDAPSDFTISIEVGW